MKVTFIKAHEYRTNHWAAGERANITPDKAKQWAEDGILTIDDGAPAIKTGISPDDEPEAEPLDLEALADAVAEKVEEKRQENSFFGKRKKQKK